MLAEWANAHLPAFLQRPGFFGATYWQLALCPLVFVTAWGVARLFSGLLALLAGRIAKLTKVTWDDLLAEKLHGPTWMFLTGIFGLLMQQLLELPPRLHAKVLSVNVMLTLLAGFWALLRALDIVHQTVRGGTWIAHRPAAVPVLGLLIRVGKVVVATLGVVTAMQQLGYPVAGVLAGLGVGGLAVALAAQKTLENLLGSVMLTVDQPMRAGDLIQVDTVLGVVEEVGLRSTKIRTAARTVISIPNGKLADTRIENLQSRDRIQLNFVVSIAYATPLGVLKEIVSESRKLLAAHPKTYKPDNAVHLMALGESALQLEVNTWIQVAPGDDFRDIRQEIFYALLGIIEAKGSALAYPTRTLFLEKT